MNYKYENNTIIEYKPNKFDKKYRYLLRNKGNKTILCICLNPNKANRHISDRTTKNLEIMAKKNGFDSIALVNLYPRRSEEVVCLPDKENKCAFKKNLKVIKKILNDKKINDVLIATGNDFSKRGYLKETFKQILDYCLELINNPSSNKKIWAIKLTKDNFPMHPSRAPHIVFTTLNIQKLYFDLIK